MEESGPAIVGGYSILINDQDKVDFVDREDFIY